MARCSCGLPAGQARHAESAWLLCICCRKGFVSCEGRVLCQTGNGLTKVSSWSSNPTREENEGGGFGQLRSRTNFFQGKRFARTSFGESLSLSQSFQPHETASRRDSRAGRLLARCTRVQPRERIPRGKSVQGAPYKYRVIRSATRSKRSGGCRYSRQLLSVSPN